MRRFGQPTPAMVVALVALFVALGGSSYAAISINGKNIKNRSISGKKVKRDTLGGGEVVESRLGQVPAAARADSAGRADSASRADSAGNALALGGLGTASFVRNYTVVTGTSTDAGQTKQAFATCPGSTRVIGGGAQISGTGVALMRVSRPVAGASPVQWFAEARGLTANDQFALEVTAICADVH